MHQGHVKTIEIMNINCGKSPSPRHGILPCHCSPKSPRFRVTTWNPRESQAKQSKQSAKNHKYKLQDDIVMKIVNMNMFIHINNFVEQRFKSISIELRSEQTTWKVEILEI